MGSFGISQIREEMQVHQWRIQRDAHDAVRTHWNID